MLGKKENEDLGGILIILIVAIVLIAGIYYGIFVLATHVEKKIENPSKEVMGRESADHEEIISGPITGPIFSKLHSPPKFHGGGS